jgi:gluconolactonase
LAAASTVPVLAAPAAGGIRGVVAPGVEPQLVSEAFLNTEGPLGVPDGTFYVSDTNASKTYHIGLDGKIEVFRERTNRGNGIAINREGELLWAEGDGPRILKQDSKTGGYRNLTAGTRLFQPNDLIVDAKGGVYFTDPGPRPVVPGLKVNVYYIPAGGKPMVVDDSIARPNGVTLASDGKTLYVDNTVGDEVFAFDVQADGTVKNKRVFAKLRDIPAGQEGVGDGMALDREGRLYVTSLVGVQVFDAKGGYLGTIKVPRQPSNVAFAGPDKKTLYITARQGLYRMQMLSQGPDRPGK